MIFNKLPGYSIFYHERRILTFYCLIFDNHNQLRMPVTPFNQYLRGVVCDSLPAVSRCGWGSFGHFFSSVFSLFFLPLWETVRYEILSQRAFKPQTTNQSTPVVSGMRTPVYSCYYISSKVLGGGQGGGEILTGT